jgi:hypothetical protein
LWHFQNDFASGLVSGELLESPVVHSLSLLSFPLLFLFPFCQSVFCLVLVVVVCCWLSLPVASGIAAETQFTGWCLSLAFTHYRELMKSVGKLW